MSDMVDEVRKKEEEVESLREIYNVRVLLLCA